MGAQKLSRMDKKTIIQRTADHVREQLLADVWKYDGLVVTRTVDNFVAKLRKHLEADPLNPLHLLTVHGSGYRLVL